MNLLHVLFAWYLCLSSTADARRIWCYCDRGLCTTDKYYSEPCSNVLPVAIRDHLLDVFFEPNKTKISLRVFMETMMEKGVDQRTIVEIVKDITPDDMMLLEKAVGGNVESLRQVLTSVEKDTMLELMKGVMEQLRAIKRDKKLTEMSNEWFQAARAHVMEAFTELGLPDYEMNSVRKRISKNNVRHFWTSDAKKEVMELFYKMDDARKNGKTCPIQDYAMNVTPLEKSNETDAMDLAFVLNNLLEKLIARQSTRQERAANRKTEDVEQFCMMALLKDRREIRFCGHFASQLTGFQFREGCHYENVLGFASAYFCRCAEHMCNVCGSVTSGWNIYVASVVMLFFLI